MSIRLRLTLLYSAILAFTLIAFSSILYIAQANLTYNSIKADLTRQASIFAGTQGRFPGPRRQPPADPQALDSTRFGGDTSGATLPGRWTQTRNLDGTVIARTFDLSEVSLPLSAHGLQTVQNGADWFETAQVQEQPLLIYSRPFMGQSSTTEIVQMAFPITQPEQSLNALRLSLIAGSILVIMAAFAIGWVLAGAALRPIDRITHTAQVIGAEHNFGRRLQHTGPPDEIGRLAITFNDMLAELESAYRQVEGALDSQRRFVADASHELRTPLTTVRGNIELLRREVPVDPGERGEILSDTTDEVERLIRLVNQLLVLARADAGQALRRDVVAVAPLLEDVTRQARLLAPHADAIPCDAPADALVLGDRDALKQVLLILVDNALVHTAPGTSIAVAADAAGGQVAISVRDNGTGIPPDVLPHIFERFYRGQLSRTGRSTGLGLAIARELVVAQGGAITVQSRLGQGSTFTITLPEPS